MFEEIKKKYPKAWRVFIEWCSDIDFYDRWDWDNDNDGEITLTEEFEFINLIGWLFKFFDERGIIIITECERIIEKYQQEYENYKWINHQKARLIKEFIKDLEDLKCLKK